MDRGRNGMRGKLLATALVAIGITAAVVGYLVRPLKSRSGGTTTQPVDVQPAPAER